jgi:superfamily I DNA/RNA helicase
MTDTWWVKQGQLDPHQKKVFTLSTSDDHLVKGPPGSGKTNLLLLRGKQLIGSNIPNIVVVVHTRTLQEFIRSGAHNYGIPAGKIVTFRKLGTELLYRVGAPVTLPSGFNASREVLVDALQDQIDAGRIHQEHSCVLVDEAQDFLPGEIAILRTLGERFFGVADSRQKIYKGQDSIKKLEKEINTVKLPFHYRNGHKICIVADGLAKEVTGEPTLLETSKYPEAKLESTVERLPFNTLDEQCDELIERLDTQIKAYPGELIGIACPRGEDLVPVVDRLRNSEFADQLIVQTSDDGYEAFDPDKSVCVSKLHSAKGLEFRAFHILAAEGLKKFPLQRELTFMGVTRAKTSLCIYHSADLPSYLEGALSKLNPDTPLVGIDALLEADDEEGED